MHYPTNYGYVPKTISGDGDPVDVLVITPVPLIPGVVVTCRPIGILKMEDEAGEDGKVLAVPTDKILSIYTHWQKPEDLNPLRLKTIAHFFEHYKDLEPGKWVKVLGWEGPDAGAQGNPGRHRELQEAERLTPGERRAERAMRQLARCLQVRANPAGKGLRSFEVFQVVVDALALALQESLHRVGESRMRQPVGAGGLHRHQRARHLVLALRAALEAAAAVGDAPLQRLVVAGLEVQAVHPLQRAPVAAVGHARRRTASSPARSGCWRSACRRARR